MIEFAIGPGQYDDRAFSKSQQVFDAKNAERPRRAATKASGGRQHMAS